MGDGGCGCAGVVSGVDGAGDGNRVCGSIWRWVIGSPVPGSVDGGKPTGGCASAGRAVNITAANASATRRACAMGTFLPVIVITLRYWDDAADWNDARPARAGCAFAFPTEQASLMVPYAC
jgi:hypothetical protein